MRTRREEERYERRKVFWATVVSVVFHVLLILLLALTLKKEFDSPKPPEPEPIELTMVEPLPTPTPPPASRPAYIETTDSQLKDKPPDKADFESDKDTHAASKLAATGNLPVPTMEGEKIPALTFENKDYTPGPTPQPSSPSAPPPTQVTPPTPEPQPTPEPVPTPEATPSPAPTPEATPSATPPPRNYSDVALLEPPKPRNTPRPEVQKPQQQQPQQPQPPTPPSRPGYQPQTQVTRIQGGVTTRGVSAVNAVATPMGRYQKAISNAIGSRWYFKVNEHRDMLQGGTVDVRFTVKSNGKIEDLKVLRNTSNGNSLEYSLNAIQGASDSEDIPPIPKDLVPQLKNGSIEVEFSFTILSD